jgi:hypothetical protein
MKNKEIKTIQSGTQAGSQTQLTALPTFACPLLDLGPQLRTFAQLKVRRARTGAVALNGSLPPNGSVRAVLLAHWAADL